MAHGTHQDVNHPENKPNISFSASFWFVVILVGLFIAALNFVNMSGSDEKEGGEATTEMKQEGKTIKEPLSDENKSLKMPDTVNNGQAATAPAGDKH